MDQEGHCDCVHHVEAESADRKHPPQILNDALVSVLG